MRTAFSACIHIGRRGKRYQRFRIVAGPVAVLALGVDSGPPAAY